MFSRNLLTVLASFFFCALTGTGCAAPGEPQEPTYFVALEVVDPAGPIHGDIVLGRVTGPEAEEACHALGAELATDVHAAQAACAADEDTYGWSCWTGARLGESQLAVLRTTPNAFVAAPEHLAFPVCVVQ